MKKRLLAILMVGASVLAGCGRTEVGNAPELIEPAAINSAYRPAEYGNIGKVSALMAKVVPTDYCSFYHTNAEISEIFVEVGDMVEEGELLAYADVDAARETLAGLKENLANENKIYDINSRMAQVRIHQIQVSEEIPEEDKASQIAVEQENMRYDKLLHEYRVSHINESIALQQEIIDEGTLVAKHAGMVSYVKNIGLSTSAGAYENIVVVSDLQDTYLELENTIASYSAYARYEEKYIKLAGKRYDVTEIPYSMDETILAQTSGKYPNVRLSCPEAGELTLGATYPVYYQKEKSKDVLIIGVDSLYGEEGNQFVYVKNESGERERRIIEIGDSDDNYVEVTEGLTEGELVYYSSDARMPAEYEEYTVKYTDYEIINKSTTYSFENEQIAWYDAEYEGTIKQIHVKKGDTVEAGDLLYVIDSGEGRAALKSAESQISRENTSYAQTVKSFDEQLAAETNEDARQLLTLQKELAYLNHTNSLRQLQKTYDDMRRNNDGSGKISVYAKNSGTISKIEVTEEETVLSGAHVLAVGEPAGNKLLVQMAPVKGEITYKNNIADIGEEVKITVSDTLYVGHCTGYTMHFDCNLGKAYVSSEEEGSYLSYGTEAGYSYPAFYVEMADEKFYEGMYKGEVAFSYVTMQDIFAIPTKLVYKETRVNRPNQTYYYVWRILDGELVKQFVMVDESLSTGGKTVILSGLKEQDILAQEKK